jgi:hypothetical protein
MHFLGRVLVCLAVLGQSSCSVTALDAVDAVDDDKVGCTGATRDGKRRRGPFPFLLFYSAAVVASTKGVSFHIDSMSPNAVQYRICLTVYHGDSSTVVAQCRFATSIPLPSWVSHNNNITNFAIFESHRPIARGRVRIITPYIRARVSFACFLPVSSFQRLSSRMIDDSLGDLYLRIFD